MAILSLDSFFDIFIPWCVLPTGALLLFMLVNGNAFSSNYPNSIARFLLRKNIGPRVEVLGKHMYLSLGSFCSFVSAFLVVLCYVSQAVSQDHLTQITSGLEKKLPGAKQAAERDLEQNGKHFWICIATCIVWVASWRLAYAFDVGDYEVAKVQAPTPSQRRLPNKLVYIGVFIALCILTDIALCRLNYNLLLYRSVTSRKTEVQAFGLENKCSDAKLNDYGLSTNCKQFCREVRELSQERLNTLRFVRDWYPCGGIAARFFDRLRGEDSASEQKINEIFKVKSCERALLSSDKSNREVNLWCVLVGLFIPPIAVWALGQVMETRDEKHAETYRPSAPPPPPDHDHME
jgi:hypothetical protein